MFYFHYVLARCPSGKAKSPRFTNPSLLDEQMDRQRKRECCFGTCVCVDNQAKAGVSHHERNVSSACWHLVSTSRYSERVAKRRKSFWWWRPIGGAIRHTGEVKLVYSKRGYQTFTLNMFLLLLLDVDFGLCVCFLPFACACLFIRGAVCTRVTAACYRFL